MSVTTYPHVPDYAIPPGDTILETIESLGMDQKDLATRLASSEKHISQLVNGHVALTYEMAEKLELVTGVPARIWNNLEMNYREKLTRMEAAKRLESDLDWLKRIPTTELLICKKIEPSSDKAMILRATLGFFGVSSVEAWKDIWTNSTTAFRRSKCFEMKPEATAAWLRLGELEAISIKCCPYDRGRFIRALTDIRKLTVEPPQVFQPAMTKLCAEAGVALVFIPEMKGCPASGAARWLASDRAIIQLSLRHKTDDHLWFSFFHEAGHVTNDPKKQIFIDDGTHNGDEQERRADLFASNILIPPEHVKRLETLKTPAAVTAFANFIGVSPGIVVGRLQHDKLIAFSYMNPLKRKLKWVKPQTI